ncbi:MAG: ABC transporter ATP-binding protein [Bacteroidetes bacterium]|nr:ABC transporter ATP-binding protein [Bacteroidota bacterium]MBL6943937.1 ABC transporter ATP-binding protein [Bacteroidales bacterium]
MIKINKLSKSYQQRGQVLDNLDLEIKESCSLAITGPSGSGKTTLLNIIGMLTVPDKGEVFFNGEDITKLDADRAAYYRSRKIGFIFQDHLLLPHLTIYENILLPLLANKESNNSKNEASKYALTLMERTGIVEIKNKFPWQVSGGEAQRATLVRALINKPELLLADEPTGSLDEDNAMLMANILVDLNKELGTTLIVVTHSENLASKMQKKMHIEKGVLVPSA